jgi:hypothetical protein
MAEPEPTIIWEGPVGALLGICRVCDADVPSERWGDLIEGDVCLGCGAPVYEYVEDSSNP